jgi:2-hydroxycyclohexanecarboxyl-CoA dehydrogenase
VYSSIKTALITGGGSGIGRGLCLRLAQDGIDVAIFDIDFAAARNVAQECGVLGRRAFAFELDVAERSRVNATMARVHQELGPVHILVNNAGIAEYAPILRMTEGQWDRMIAVHLKGTFNCTTAVVQDMIDANWGRIVNITARAGLSGVVGLAHYYSAKEGVIGFTKALAQELGPKGITVNAIAPGLIETPMLRQAIPNQELLRSFKATLVGRTAVRRAGTPEDIAAACAYVVSDEASYFTGQVISPNGGIFS